MNIDFANILCYYSVFLDFRFYKYKHISGGSFPRCVKQIMVGCPSDSHTNVSKKKQKQWTEGKLILADRRHFVVTSEASHVTTHWPRVSPFASPSSPEPLSPTCSASPLCAQTLIDWCGTCLHRNQATLTCINDGVDTRASGLCPDACSRVSEGVLAPSRRHFLSPSTPDKHKPPGSGEHSYSVPAPPRLPALTQRLRRLLFCLPELICRRYN